MKKIKIKGGRKRLALFILIMWLIVLLFFITDDFSLFFKLFIIISNIAGWSLIILLFVEKEGGKGKECGEKVKQFVENRRILFILLLVVISSIAVTSFFDLLFPILFSGVMAIPFFGAMLNNIFHPLEDMLSIWYFSKITSPVFIKFLIIFIIFCTILFLLIEDVAIFFLFISYVFAGINFGLYAMARWRIKIHTPE